MKKSVAFEAITSSKCKGKSKKEEASDDDGLNACDDDGSNDCDDEDDEEMISLSKYLANS